MAAITVTAGSVVPGSDANVATGFAGATITAGQVLYIDTANSNVLKLAQCDGTALEATVAGIALNGASSGQVVNYIKGGTVTIGGTTVAGTMYGVGTTAGDIIPHADIATTNKVSYVGYATTTGILSVQINNTGITKA